ncbi:helix-turn-helix domain-containing protein [Bradyrhizobium liaoningense]|uniref:helix-turn-helix domain-containing protein n=1 Tax=Bradyrhizobium liaoningense TaxID=43992 RepID=UPI001BA777F8|nr:helix-turn-helix domain-containing protein [Bradyrhizobium liaoningense]MBR0986142.1 helix-turn-helix domain-containing protein [Bradyrhizobium liaoningense]
MEGYLALERADSRDIEAGQAPNEPSCIRPLSVGAEPARPLTLRRPIEPSHRGYRTFASPDDWFEAISPHFVGARFAQRSGRLSLSARFDAVADTMLVDMHVRQSGFRQGQRGFHVEGCAKHRYFALWQAKGAASLAQSRNVIDLTAGRWVLVKATSPCEFGVRDGGRCIGIMLPERQVDRWGDLIGEGGRLLSPCEDGDMAAAMLIELLERSTQLGMRAQQSFELLLVDLLDSVLDKSAPTYQTKGRPEVPPAKLRRAKELVEAQLGNPALRPEDIGHAIGVSRRSLYNLFSQIGATPMGYVREQRLKEAARRLRNASLTDATVTSIAYDLGFADPSHFARLFRAQYGMSPRQWGNATPDR